VREIQDSRAIAKAIREVEAMTFTEWDDAFLLAFSAAGHGDKIKHYEPMGVWEHLPDLYQQHGWGPVEAMHNEIQGSYETGQYRSISDGPREE
jgi:hypothetical protein